MKLLTVAAPLHSRSVRCDELNLGSSAPTFGSTRNLQHILAKCPEILWRSDVSDVDTFRDIGGLAKRLDLDSLHGCFVHGRPDCLGPARRRPSPTPGFWYTGFAPLGDSSDYGSEFLAFVSQRIGEARRVPLVKSRLNQAATLQQL
jgi:hypothetical protein